MRQENKFPAPSVAQSVAPPSPPRSSFSTITLEDSPSEPKSVERSFATSLQVNCPVFYAKDESVAILDTGATANLVRFQ